MTESQIIQAVSQALTGESPTNLRFRSAATRFANLIEAVGIKIEPFESVGLPLFSALPFPHQEAVIQDLQNQIELIMEAKPVRGDYSYNRRMAWSKMRQCGFIMASDVFDKLQDEDIIEIWDCEGRQIFRSFHGLQFLSYTLEEIYSYPFFELFERDETMASSLMDVFAKLVDGRISTTTAVDLPPHIVRERLSRRKRASVVTSKYVSPLKNKKGDVVAMFHTVTARSLDN